MTIIFLPTDLDMKFTVEIIQLFFILTVFNVRITYGKTVTTKGSLHKIYSFPPQYTKPAEVSEQSSLIG